MKMPQSASRVSSLALFACFILFPIKANAKNFKFSSASNRCVDRDGNDGLNPGLSKGNWKGSWGPCSDLSRKSLKSSIYKGRMQRKRVSLRGSSLEGSDLSGLILRQADLSYTNLKNTNLTGVIFDHVDLTGADLSGAIGLDVVFIGSDVGRYKIRGVTFDDQTLIKETWNEEKRAPSLEIEHGLMELKGGFISVLPWDAEKNEGQISFHPYGNQSPRVTQFFKVKSKKLYYQLLFFRNTFRTSITVTEDRVIDFETVDEID